jgi:hypothetical protein
MWSVTQKLRKDGWQWWISVELVSTLKNKLVDPRPYLSRFVCAAASKFGHLSEHHPFIYSLCTGLRMRQNLSWSAIVLVCFLRVQFPRKSWIFTSLGDQTICLCLEVGACERTANGKKNRFVVRRGSNWQAQNCRSCSLARFFSSSVKRAERHTIMFQINFMDSGNRIVRPCWRFLFGFKLGKIDVPWAVPYTRLFLRVTSERLRNFWSKAERT